MIHDNRKYRTHVEVGNPPYKTHMKLTIANIQPEDYGKLIAKNFFFMLHVNITQSLNPSLHMTHRNGDMCCKEPPRQATILF